MKRFGLLPENNLPRF